MACTAIVPYRPPPWLVSVDLAARTRVFRPPSDFPVALPSASFPVVARPAPRVYVPLEWSFDGTMLRLVDCIFGYPATAPPPTEDGPPTGTPTGAARRLRLSF